MAYTEADLEQLIKSVESEFNAHLSGLSKSEVLAKGEFPPKKDEKKPESKEEPKKEESKEEPQKEPEGHEDKKPEASGEKAPEGEQPAEAKPDGEKPAQGGDHCDYDEQDMEHMHKMYMSMSKGELKAHHDSCRAALEGQGMAKCGETSMAKSETDTSIEVKAEIVAAPNKEAELLKSELAAEKAKAETLQKNLDAVTAFVTKLVEKRVAPQGKAITSMETIAKSEGGTEGKTLAKSEIDARLLKAAQDPKTNGSDREAINAYYLNSGSINTISHLLK